MPCVLAQHSGRCDAPRPLYGRILAHVCACAHGLQVRSVSSRPCGQHSQYNTTVLELTHQPTSTSIRVNHYHVQFWPDHGVPGVGSVHDTPDSYVSAEDSADILDLIFAVRKVTRDSQAPIVTHCSAGLSSDACIAILILVRYWADRHLHRCVPGNHAATR